MDDFDRHAREEEASCNPDTQPSPINDANSKKDLAIDREARTRIQVGIETAGDAVGCQDSLVDRATGGIEYRETRTLRVHGGIGSAPVCENGGTGRSRCRAS